MIAVNPSAAGRPAKIQSHHLERWAIDYVRQSHPQQVQRHRESAQVQARLQERALAWGWPAERIRVLDGDQGRSGTAAAGRDDFAWLLSEIALGHVGLVLCFQINRLAREDEDWEPQRGQQTTKGSGAIFHGDHKGVRSHFPRGPQRGQGTTKATTKGSSNHKGVRSAL
jgi:hypothetical protein